MSDQNKPTEVLLSGDSSNEQRAQASALFLGEPEEDEGSAAAAHAARVPYPINVGGAQLLPGRSRACCFWISALVPPATRYIIDSNQIASEALPRVSAVNAGWAHNPAGDEVPADCLLVVVSPKDADQIRKAMATWKAVPHPSWVAARIIDAECRADPTLAGRMRWKVAS